MNSLVHIALVFLLGAQGQITPTTPTSQSSFASTHNSLCTGVGNGSTACGELLYNMTNEHYRFTDFLSREDSAIEDAVEGAENDWTFIVNQLSRLNPQIQQFQASNVTTKQRLIAGLQANVTSFVNQVNGLLAWEHGAFTNILAADENDSFAFTQQLDAVVSRVLAHAMNVTDLGQQQVSGYVSNSSRYLDQFFSGQFGVANSSLVAKQLDMLSQLKALQNVTNFYNNYIQSNARTAMEVAASESANLNVVLPRAIAASQSALNATLTSLITQFLTTGNMSADIASQLSRFRAFADSQLASYSSQFNDSLDGVANTIYANLNQTQAAASAGAAAAITLFNQSQANFLVAWEAMTSALSNMSSNLSDTNASKYLVKDSELGADSLLLFNQVASNISDLLTLRERLDRERLANSSNAVTNYAATLLSDLKSVMNQLVMPGGGNRTVQSLNEWQTYAASSANQTLPELNRYFEDGVKEVSRVVFDAIGNGSNISSLSSLLGRDFSSTFLNVSELNAFAANMSLSEEAAANAIQDAIVALTQTLNSSGQSAELAVDSLNSSLIVANLSDSYAGVLQGQNQTDLDLFSRVDANQVQAPANVELGNYAGEKAIITNLTDRQSVLNNRLSNDAPALLNAAKTVSSLVAGIETAVEARTDRLADMIKGVSQTTARMVKNKESSFLNALPTATGFQKAANSRAAALQQLESWITAQGAEKEGGIRNSISAISDFRTGLETALQKYNSALSAIAERERMQTPDFEGMNALKNAASRVNAEAVIGQLKYDLTAQVNAETKSFNAKVVDVSNKMSNEQSASSQRNTVLTRLESELGASNSTANYFLKNDAEKVIDLAQSIGNAANATNATLIAIKPANAAIMTAQSQLLRNEIDDLLYQVRESGPDFVAQSEIYNITRTFLPALTALNNTVSAIYAEALALPVAAASFLHVPTSNETAKTVRGIVSQLRDRAAIDEIKREIDMHVKQTSAEIKAHAPVNVRGNISESVDLEALAFAAAVDAGLEQIEKKMNFSNAEIMHFLFSSSGSQEQKEHEVWDSSLQKLSALAAVLADSDSVQTKDVKKLVSKTKLKLNLLRDSLARLDGLKENVDSTARVVLSSDPADAASEADDKMDQSGRLLAARAWSESLMDSVTKRMEERWSSQFGGIDGTLLEIEDVQKRLRKIAKTESKIEADFDSKVMAKLRAATVIANETAGDLFADLSHDIDKERRKRADDSSLLRALKQRVSENSRLRKV